MRIGSVACRRLRPAPSSLSRTSSASCSTRVRSGCRGVPRWRGCRRPRSPPGRGCRAAPRARRPAGAAFDPMAHLSRTPVARADGARGREDDRSPGVGSVRRGSTRTSNSTASGSAASRSRCGRARVRRGGESPDAVPPATTRAADRRRLHGPSDDERWPRAWRPPDHQCRRTAQRRGAAGDRRHRAVSGSSGAGVPTGPVADTARAVRSAVGHHDGPRGRGAHDPAHPPAPERRSAPARRATRCRARRFGRAPARTSASVASRSASTASGTRVSTRADSAPVRSGRPRSRSSETR